MAFQVADMCGRISGRTPTIEVEEYSESVDGNKGVRFSYVPMYLQYILAEILKNSCNATALVVSSQRELAQRPIQIIVCADKRRVAICVNDQAGGIPFDVGKQVWSYLYSTTSTKKDA